MSLGLAPNLPLQERFNIVPVVALSAPVTSPVLLTRMRQVPDALLADGLSSRDLEVWLVEADGSYTAAHW